MKRFLTRSVQVMFVTQLLLAIAVSAWPACDGSSTSSCEGIEMSDANYRVYFSGVAAVGGEVDGVNTDIVATNMYPFVNYSYQADLPFWYERALANYTDGFNYRQSLLLVGVTLPDGDPESLTPQQKMLLYPKENYETVGLVSMPELSSDGSAYDCVLPNGVAEKLERARDIFAYDTLLGYPDPVTAKEALLNSIKSLSSSYLMVGDEFMIDALEFRFSGSSLGMDAKLDDQIELLTKAQACYDKSIKSFIYGFGQSLTSGEYLSDYFDNSAFNLFNISVERMSMALRERSAKQLIRDISPSDPASLMNAKIAAAQVLRETYTTSYLVAAAVAQHQQDQFAANGGDRLVNALQTLKTQRAVYDPNLNPLGFDDRFIPMQDFEVFRVIADTYAGWAAEDQQYLDAARKEIDSDAGALRTAWANLANSGGYKTQIAQLTGIAINDPSFTVKAESAGLDLFQCPFAIDDTVDFNSCLGDKTQGVLGSKYEQIWERVMSLKEIEKRRDNHLEAIRLEIQKHEQMIEIENIYNNKYRTTLTKFLDDVVKARQELRAKNSDWQLFSGTLSVIAAVVAAPVTGGATIVLGLNSLQLVSGAAAAGQASLGRQNDIDRYALEDKQLALEVHKEIDLQEALRDYRIAQLEAVDTVNIMNMVNQLAEFEIEVGLGEQQVSAALTDFTNYLREKNNLVTLYKKAQEYATFEDERLKNNMAEVRILRSQAAIELTRDLNQGVHYAYLAAKALEYKYLTPLVNIQVDQNSLDMSELYKVQTPADLKGFLLKLQSYDTCSWGSVQPMRITLSLAENILGLTYDYLNPSGALSSGEVSQLRYEKLQAFIADHIDKSNNSLRFDFVTTVKDPAISRPGMNNLKVWYGSVSPPCDPVPAKGIAVQFKTNQTATIQPWVSLKQRGHSTYLRKTGEVVEYTPVSQYLNMQSINDDQSVVTAGYFSPYVNVDPDTISIWSPSFKGRGVASSNWEFIIDDYGWSPYRIDWSKVTDIKIYMDAMSFTAQ